MISTDFLNELRKRQDLKLKDIAAHAGYSIGYMCAIFSGKVAVIPKNAQMKIAKALGVPAKLIFNDKRREMTKNDKPKSCHK